MYGIEQYFKLRVIVQQNQPICIESAVLSSALSYYRQQVKPVLVFSFSAMYQSIPEPSVYVTYCIRETPAGKTFAVLWFFTRLQIFSHKLWPCRSAILVYRTATANLLLQIAIPLKTQKFSPWMFSCIWYLYTIAYKESIDIANYR